MGYWSLGPYRLTDDGTLWLKGSLVNLSPLQRKLLLVLIEESGQALTREELAQRVWNHNQVSPISISRTIHSLRRVFDGGPLGGRVIKTSYGQGYGLGVDVERVADGEDPAAPLEVQADHHLPEHYVEAHYRMRYGTARQLGLAASHLRQACALHPGHAPSWALLVQVLLMLHRAGQPRQLLCDEVDQVLLRAAQRNPPPADLVMLQACVQSLLHWQPAAAQRMLHQGLNPLVPLGDLELLWTDHLLAQGQLEEAERLLLALEQSGVAGVPFQRARWAAQARDFDGCLRWLDTQCAADPAFVPAYHYKAMLLAHLDAPAAALTTYWSTTILADDSDSFDPCHAYLLARAGDTDAATVQVRRSLDAGDRRHPTPDALWALAAAAAGDALSCGRLVERALERRCGAASLLVREPFLERFSACQPLSLLRDEVARQRASEKPPLEGAVAAIHAVGLG